MDINESKMIIQNMLFKFIITILIMGSDVSEKELSGLALSKLNWAVFSFGS